MIWCDRTQTKSYKLHCNVAVEFMNRLFFIAHILTWVGKAQVLRITLTIAPHYLNVSNESVTVSQHAQRQGSETDTFKWNSTTFFFYLHLSLSYCNVLNCPLQMQWGHQSSKQVTEPSQVNPLNTWLLGRLIITTSSNTNLGFYQLCPLCYSRSETIVLFFFWLSCWMWSWLTVLISSP